MNLWNWLPAFRVVAQTEHLPSASEQLHISASALSRTIRLLEEEVGRPLFDRVGRRLVLNANGQALLRGIRDAMRRVDDALSLISEDIYRGPLRVSAPGAFTGLIVLPALEQLGAAHPSIVPHLVQDGPLEVNAKLLDGRLDLALLDDPIFHEQLQAERLVELGYGVYCGPSHPLHDAGPCSLETVSAHPFVAPPEGADDHWPAHLPRKISMAISSLQMGVEVCARGRLVAVLPDLIAQHTRGPDLPPLRKLCPVPQETALYAIRRPALGVHGMVDAALEAIQSRLSSLDS